MTIQELINRLSDLPEDVRRSQTARVWDKGSGCWHDVVSVSPYEGDCEPSLCNPVDIDINTHA